MNQNEDRMPRASYLWIALLCLTTAFVTGGTFDSTAVVFSAVGIAALTGCAVTWTIHKRLTTGRIYFLIVASGVLLRAIYILYTGVETRQHDVYTFGEPEGHAGYIEYLYSHLHLPDFDPREIWQYYHPPFHHILVVVWLKINTALGVSWFRAKENIQVLSLLYSSLALILSYKIFSELGLKKNGMIPALSILAFHPTFIIMAGSVNNDILSIVFLLGAVYYTMLWWKTPSLPAILKIALCVGFGMMTKLSVSMAAPAIALVFLVKLILEKKKFLSYVKQFLLFGLVCAPLGLWWGVRNYILFKMPFTYVPSLGDQSHQYIGNYSVMTRLFDFSLYQFKNVFVSWGDPYFDHNVFIGLFKTSTFGEQQLMFSSSAGYGFAEALFYANLSLILLSVAAMVWVLFKKNTLEKMMKAFLFTLYFTFLFSYIQFCFAFPHTCTQNIRYATPCILVGTLCIGLLTEHLSEKPGKAAKAGYCLLGTLTCLFVFFSFLFYIALAGAK